MRFGDRSHDREAETRSAATPGVVGSAEAVERPCCERRRKAVALVGDVELDVTVRLPCRQLDRAAAVHEPVRDEVSERLLEPDRVPLDDDVAAGDVNRAAELAGARREPRCNPVEELACPNRLSPDGECALVDPCDEQQVFGEAGEPLGLLGRRPQRVLELLPRPCPPNGELQLDTEQCERRRALLVDICLELWAVVVVAGSAGAIASFFQTGDAS